MIASYADFLSNNPDLAFPRPHPLFFSHTQCSGSLWPQFDDVVPINVRYNLPFSPNLEAIYIPAYWTVVLYKDPIAGSSVSRTFCSSNAPVLLSSLLNIFFNTIPPNCVFASPPQYTNESVFNNVRSIMMTSMVPLTTLVYRTECWQFDMCNQYVTTNMNGSNLTSYQPGSQECDSVMNGFCSAKDGYTCRLNQQAGDNLLLPECGCVKDEMEIRDTFCHPGDTSQQCQDAGKFQQFVPVICFGKNCGFQGYRFGRMLSQKCNVTLCQQLINILGQNNAVDVQSVLYCGTKPPDPTPIDSNTVSDPGVNTSQTDLNWLYLTIGIVGYVVLIPLSVLLFYRSMQNEKLDIERDKRKLETKTKLITLLSY